MMKKKNHPYGANKSHAMPDLLGSMKGKSLAKNLFSLVRMAYFHADGLGK
jgi:hypothetical protein